MTTKTLPTSPYFKEVYDDPLDGDIILWRNSSGTIHHMGIWVEDPEKWGGPSDEPVLSARGHGGMSRPWMIGKTGENGFKQAVDWTGIGRNWFDVDYKVFRFKGADTGAPNCPLK